MSHAIVVDDLHFSWPDVLLLDEPTSNLDWPASASSPRPSPPTGGALLVASHDLPFLRGAGITRWLRLEGRLLPVDPP